MLISLITAQRCQTLHFLNIKDMTFKKNSVCFQIQNLLKQSRPGNYGTTIDLEAYPPDRRLCVVKLLKCYLDRTAHLRGNETQLFINFQKPYKKVSKDTLSRWLKLVLNAAGIDTEKYKAHSTRSAATSAAKAIQVPIMDILQTAGWSSEPTFRKFYDKPTDLG